MGKPRLRSVLYRLIEAGQLARRASLAPLETRGLEPGDDAVLFLLRDLHGASESEIGHALDVPDTAIGGALKRLAMRGLIERRAAGPDLTPGFALTARGEQVRRILEENWDQLEEALLGELSKKKRKGLRMMLERFVDLLELQIRPGA